MLELLYFKPYVTKNVQQVEYFYSADSRLKFPHDAFRSRPHSLSQVNIPPLAQKLPPKADLSILHIR